MNMKINVCIVFRMSATCNLTKLLAKSYNSITNLQCQRKQCHGKNSHAPGAARTSPQRGDQGHVARAHCAIGAVSCTWFVILDHE